MDGEIRSSASIVNIGDISFENGVEKCMTQMVGDSSSRLDKWGEKRCNAKNQKQESTCDLTGPQKSSVIRATNTSSENDVFRQLVELGINGFCSILS